MKLFKRVGFWVLLALVVAALIFVFSKPKLGTEIFTIEDITLRQDYSNYEMVIRVSYDNKTDQEINTAESAALLAEGDRKIPAFFLAIAPPPKIPANKRTKIDLKYWLEADDLKGPLWLDILGSRVQLPADLL
jgi:hypothetical protein